MLVNLYLQKKIIDKKKVKIIEIQKKNIYIYTSYIKMYHCCKKAIARKKLVLKRSVLHLGNDIRWLDLR